MVSFIDLGVPARLNTLLAAGAIESPTPIQEATLPDALAGRNVLGRGRTGSGKTLAFVLPLLVRLAGGERPRAGAPRALILAPTRELATQIDATLTPLARAVGLRSQTVFGGIRQHSQVAALRRGVDIVIACPGRLEDLIRQGHCALDAVEITVIDEADHLADLGFLPAVLRILRQIPVAGQKMLFSATLDRAIDRLVAEFLVDHVLHGVDAVAASPSSTAHHVLHIDRASRLPILIDLTSAGSRTVVFARTKHGASNLSKHLNRAGVTSVELHGDLSQNARSRALAAFQAGRVSTLVATDVAARGIHVDDVTLVIHADPATDPKAYLHRSGRTGRAGNTGTVVTLMTSEQKRSVAALTRAAGVAPVTTRVEATNHAVLTTIAPGQRTLTPPPSSPVVTSAPLVNGDARRSDPRKRASATRGGRSADKRPVGRSKAGSRNAHTRPR